MPKMEGNEKKPRPSGYTPSKAFTGTLRAIPLVLVLFIGFAVGVSVYENREGTVRKNLGKRGGAESVILKEAYSHIVSGDYTKAASISADVLRTEPNNSLARFILGLADAKRGLTEEAVANFTKAVELDPDYSLAWFNLGVTEESRDEFERALTAYEKAAKLEPKNQRYRETAEKIREIMTGQGTLERREFDDEKLFLEGTDAVNRGDESGLAYAENVFRSLAKDHPYDSAAQNMLGLTLAKQGKVDEAEKIFLDIVDAEPGFADAWFNLGMVHGSMGRYDDALSDFESARNVSNLETFRKSVSLEIDRMKKLIDSGKNANPVASEPNLPDNSKAEIQDSDLSD